MDWGVSSSLSDDVDGAADEFHISTQAVLAILGWGPVPPDEGSVATVHEREFYFGFPP